MRVNSSSGVSALSPVHCFSNVSLYPRLFACFDYTSSSTIFTAFAFTNLLLLPLYVFVPLTGFHRWRRPRSATAGPASDSDVFVYNIVAVEIIGVLGLVCSCCASYSCSPRIMMAGYYSLQFAYSTQTFCHCLTCVERYLAVVHPITYLGLKTAGGVKVRHASAACVWLLCFGLTGLIALHFPYYPTVLFYTVFAIPISAMYFCSLSVLRALIRLGHRERVDKSKQRAFCTVMAIAGTLVFRVCGLLAFNSAFESGAWIRRNECVALMSGVWLCLPSSLVLPLMFLHRAGTPACCRRRRN